MKTFPLNQSQLAIFYAEQSAEGNYAINFLMHFGPEVESERLCRALERTVAAHPHLLDRVALDDEGVPVFQVPDEKRYVQSVEKIANIDAVRSTLRRKRDLLKEPLFTFRLMEGADGLHLLFDLHHIAGDGTTIQELLRDIETAYAGGGIEEESVTAEELNLAESEKRSSPAHEEESAWYAQTFGGVESESLPLRDAHGDSSEYRVAWHRLAVGKDATGALSAAAGVGVSIPFTAAFALMLRAFTGDEQVAYSTFFHGRTDKRARRTQTMMVRTLPIFHDFARLKTVRELLTQTSELLQDLRRKDSVGFGEVARMCGITGAISFIYQGSILDWVLTLAGRRYASEDLREHEPGLKLIFQLVEKEDSLWLSCEYPVAEYSEAIIGQMAECYDHILGELTSGTENLAELTNCTERQLSQLDGFNLHPDDTFAEWNGETIVSLFRRTAALYPDSVAAVFGERKYTYRELDELTDRLAAELRTRLGEWREEQVVSILIPRCEWMFIAPLAVMKAGCAYQPLDPSYPEERLNFMVKDAAASLVIADRGLRGLLSEYDGPVFFTDEEIPAAAGPVEDRLTDRSLMILLYTSGSTGVPKGVMLEHGNVLAYCHFYQKFCGFAHGTRTAAYASFGFDADMMDQYPTLLGGGTLYIIPEEIRLDLIALGEFFERNGIEIAFMTTQVAQQFASTYDTIGKLRMLLLGGEKMMSMAVPGGYTMVNIYGPTECSVAVTAKTVRENEPNIPIGQPTETTALYIVDKHLHRLPAGAPGELLITGPQVGRAYLNRPDKTAEAFIDFRNAHCYRTGDIVRYRENGDIEFVGRRDGQVKIRGFRIELKEVEAVIREYDGITDATVQAFDYPDGGKYLCAYVVSDRKVDVDALGTFICERKPPYMVPAFTFQLERIPLNVNQKVDKKALPRPDAAAASGASAAEASASPRPPAPMNALENRLHALVADIVKNGDFGVTDELARVGLTSIGAIRLVTQLYRQFNVKLESRELVKGGTLLRIENAVLEQLLSSPSPAAASEPAAPAADTAGGASETTAPLSNAQLGIYLDCLKDETATTYNVPQCFVFPASVGTDELKAAVERTISAHPALSTHFEMREGEPRIVMNAETAPVVTVETGDPEELKKDFVRPFHLARGPLYRAVVSGSTLLFDAHHLVMDGSSEAIFIRDVCAALEGGAPTAEGRSYLDHARDERTRDTSAEEAFFDERLKSVDGATEFPADLDGKEADGRIAAVDRPLDHPAVEERCRSLGITPAAFYLGATCYLAARAVNSRDVQICTISNGRGDVRLADTVGMFVNTLPLTGHIDDVSVGEFLRATAEGFSATLEHENYPFARVAEKYGLRAELMYEYQLGVIDDLSVRGEPVKASLLQLEKPKFKVAVKIVESDGQVRASLVYNDALYSRGAMERLADSFAAVVSHLLADTSAPLRRTSVMSDAQAAEVERLRTTATADVPVKLYHRGLEKYAAETPDHKALIAVDGEFTYAGFNAAANRIAHALIGRGIGKGGAVMILLPRTSHALITMFGILKSGAAFIPCDPSYPADRIALIREDSSAGLVVDEQVYAELMAESDDTSNPDVAIAPEDLAYMIYTSGSTGRPKGVMLRHIGISSYLTAHPANRHIHAIKELVSTYLSVSTISFDLSFKEYGCCFFNGLTCVFAGDDEANNPLALAELMARTGADCINGTPSRLLQYMELPAFCEGLKQCRVIMSGGEKYDKTLLGRLHELTRAKIFNTYGPTEITVSCNVADLSATDRITVGEPLLNYTEFVVDPDGNELPVGMVGELYVAGPGVAVGYNHLDELNAAKFIEYRGRRVFRSGDYARWLEDGRVVVLGRADNQVKLRGLRIELGEVESVLSAVTGIKQVLPIIRTLQGKEHLCAFFTADRKMDVEELKEELGKKLPRYMVPTAYLQLDAFPLTPNGKTDVRHLPDPEVVRTSGEYVAPVTKAERDFCEIFAGILEVDRVSVTDSFFELGGSSLTATRVLIDAKERGYSVAYADVFKYPSARELAARLAKSGDADASAADPEVTDYDYSRIDALLKSNNLDSFRQGGRLALGDVVLTGATGYLGIHILHELLEHHDGRIYAVVRRPRRFSAEKRLQEYLFYYFENGYRECFENGRITILEGDVTKPEIFDSIPVDPERPLTVINCAAVVKHFSEGTEIEDVNIGGVKTCIDFCLKTGARLIQTSTNSTGGTVIGDRGEYSEQVHYVGQILSGSKYIRSKFLAERMVLEAIVEKGLVAKVIRLGNLSARAADGEFQINFKTNSAMGRLHVYQMLGCCSYTMMASKMEFSPIDEAARAILLLATAPKECVIFHAFNNHMVLLGDVLDEVSKTLDMEIGFVEDEAFEAAVAEAGKDPEKAQIMRSLLAYRGMSAGHPFPKYNPYTIQVLARLGFRWNATSWDYVRRFVLAMGNLDFFGNR